MYSNSGRCIAAWACSQESDVEILSLAFIKYLGRKQNVPQKSLHLVWEDIQEVEQLQPAGFSSAIGHMWHATVTCLMSKVDEAEFDGDDDPYRCMCCEDPCEDADDRDATRSPEENCAFCQPCSLCSQCPVRTPTGLWCCFLCLEQENLQWIQKGRTYRRLCLVRPDLASH